ncbi:MAG: DUF480 domain-containing protein [Pirellulales bacterium]
MDSTTSQAEPVAEQSPQWRPLSAKDRRVVGVLVEKAKTTPSAYPMTLNAICTGANQKSNRDPEMSLEPDDAQQSLDRLREYGAVGEIQGDGRVPKFRHYLYKWLGVDKVELAVMAELLLRGAQTIGELRGRAARMEPIADVGALRPILASLMGKGLMVSLTPEGRGQVVTHALYTQNEMERLKTEFRNADAGAGYDDEAPRPIQQRPASTQSSVSAAPAPASNSGGNTETTALREELRVIRSEMEELQEESRSLRRDVEELRALLS